MRHVYLVRVALHPGPESKLTSPITGWLREGSLFGETFWRYEHEYHKAHIFTSKKAADAAGRAWRSRKKNLVYQVITMEEAMTQ